MHNEQTIYVYGAGGHGAVVAEIADLLGYDIASFIDDDPGLLGKTVLQWQIIGGRESIPGGAAIALGIGNNGIRAKLLASASEHGWQLPALVHPSAVISPSAELAAGTVVMAQVTVNARAIIGSGAILNTSCSVDHDCIIGSCAHLGPGVHLSGGVTVGESTLLGIGSCVKPEIKIGSRCVIGAGSVVVKDLPDGVTAFGNPARIHHQASAV